MENTLQVPAPTEQAAQIQQNTQQTNQPVPTQQQHFQTSVQQAEQNGQQIQNNQQQAQSNVQYNKLWQKVVNAVEHLPTGKGANTSWIPSTLMDMVVQNSQTPEEAIQMTQQIKSLQAWSMSTEHIVSLMSKWIQQRQAPTQNGIKTPEPMSQAMKQQALDATLSQFEEIMWIKKDIESGDQPQHEDPSNPNGQTEGATASETQSNQEQQWDPSQAQNWEWEEWGAHQDEWTTTVDSEILGTLLKEVSSLRAAYQMAQQERDAYRDLNEQLTKEKVSQWDKFDLDEFEQEYVFSKRKYIEDPSNSVNEDRLLNRLSTTFNDSTFGVLWSYVKKWVDEFIRSKGTPIRQNLKRIPKKQNALDYLVKN